jgi:hypothetical protein
MYQSFNYQDILAASERVNWRIEDIIGADKPLDFSKPFMPESLARVQDIPFMNAEEKRIFNQIRGHAYLCIFGLVEEFILPFVVDHARPELNGDDNRVRALLNFAGEEAKHIHLFRTFRDVFRAGFGTDCAIIGPAEDIARAVLSHDPLAVAMVILHIEWMTQRHYLDSVRDNQDMDPQFKSLLKHHWMEEAQHAKLDQLMVETLAEGRDAAGMARAVEEYLQIGMLLDGGLQQQVAFDIEAFERSVGRALSGEERDALADQQLQANRWTYLGSGMTHPRFTGLLERISPAGAVRVADVVPAFC